MAVKSNFVVISTVQGELVANVIKSHLESEGIPVLLEYESAGRVYGLTVDGLAQVRILVPQELAEEAWQIWEIEKGGVIREWVEVPYMPTQLTKMQFRAIYTLQCYGNSEE